MKSTANQQPSKHFQLIKKHGYQLTESLPFNLPHCNPSPTFLASFINMLIGDAAEQVPFKHSAPKIGTFLNDKVIILGHSNKVVVIWYSIVGDRIAVESKGCFLMGKPIKKITCSYYSYIADKVQNYEYFALFYEESNVLSLFKVDQHFKVTLEHEIKEKDNILAARFINHNEILLVTRSKLIKHYFVKDNRLKSTNLQLKIALEEDQQLRTAQICTSVIENQTHFCVFYTVCHPKQDKSHMHLVELLKQGGTINQHGIFFDVFEGNIPSQMLDSLIIYSYKDSFLVQNGLTIFLVQKRFGKYLRTDAISQLGKAKKITIIDKKNHLFICSIGSTEIELWQFQLKEVGCLCKLLDVIEADGDEISNKLIKVWIFITSQKPEFALMLDGGGKKVEFFLAKRSDKLSKLIDRVRKQEKISNKTKNQKLEFMAKLRQIEQLGEKLGFNRRQFYLKLWHQSQKTAVYIFEYLLPCMDFKIIFNQLTLFLRMKKLTVTEIIRILKKIESSLLEQMKKKLDMQLVRQFLKTNFQRRKLKLLSGDVSLDFHEYQAIYQSSLFDMIQRSIDLYLFPEKFKHDIVWKEQVLQKPIHIPYILRQFRLIILENYPQFLLKLLEPYKYYLKKVIETFPYLLPQYPLKISMVREELVLLSNIYPNQKIDQQQHSWLGYIRQNEWQRQNSSVDFLMKHLFNHHSTSLINDRLKQFREGLWCGKSKYSRHILLQLCKNQFEAQLPRISDATSLLFLCQRANRISLDENRPCQSEDILQIMFKFNSLPIDQYFRYKLYCKLHHLLIKERLIDPSVTILELKQLKDYKIVTYFFLGDRERIDLLFQKIAQFYPNKLQFNKIIESFIKSEECSKVELEQLVEYIKQLGESYQIDNQDLLEIIANGFMGRIQIRQKDKAIDFLNLFKQLSLSEQLLIKISVFESIKLHCQHILKQFDMGNLSYETVINDYVTVIESVVHYYFDYLIHKKKSIYIEGRQINLEFSKNIFVIVLYLKDKIYSYKEQINIYLTFSESIINWNQFQLLQDCFSQELVIDGNYISNEEYYTYLINFMFNKYYEDEELMYTEETKEHIRRLLALIRSNSGLYIIQMAKIQFVEIFEEMNKNISLQYMQIVKHQWAIPEERIIIFHEIIDLFIEKLNFQTLMKIYQLLEKIRQGEVDIQIKTEEFISYALYFCRKLVTRRCFTEICQIIYFLNQGEEEYKAKYHIMTECFLQVLADKLSPSPSIRQSSLKTDRMHELEPYKMMIDYYITNYSHLQTINKLFLDRFALRQFENDQVGAQIYLDVNLNLQQNIFPLPKDHIWSCVLAVFSKNVISLNDSKLSHFKHSLKGAGSRHSSTNSLLSAAPPPKTTILDVKGTIYCYYFITKILNNMTCLLNLQEISFSHAENINALEQLYKSQGNRKVINFKNIYTNYMKGLFKLYFINSHTNKDEQTADIDEKLKQIEEMSQSKLALLINDLNSHDEQVALIRCMKKLILLNNSVEVYAPEEKIVPKIKFPEPEEHSLPVYLERLQRLNGVRELKQSITQLALPEHYSRTYKFIEFSKIKKQFASKSNLTSEKVLIEKVLDELEHKEKSYQSIEIEPTDRQANRRLFADENGSHEDAEFNDVLQNLNEQEKEMSSVRLQLSSIRFIECEQHIYEDIKGLIQAKEYQSIRKQYEVKTILKVVNDEFYESILTSQVNATAIKPNQRKRLNKANTLKESILNSKILQLLDTLENLKLYNSSNKIHLLRTCFVTISSEELQEIENYLLKVFKINVLLDPTRNTRTIFLMLLQNIKEIDSISLEEYERVIQLVFLFLEKSREELSKSIDFIQSHRERDEGEDYFARLYLEYILKMVRSFKKSNEKLQELQHIVRLIGKERLYDIHDPLLNSLAGTDLLEPYVEAVHRLFIPNNQYAP